MEKKRSVGLIVLSVFYILIGITTLFFVPLFSILFIIIGIGLLALKNSIRCLAIISHIILAIAMPILRFAGLSGFSRQETMGITIISATIISILVHCGIIFYLTRPKVKAQFKQ